mmetsp:Transcript_41962/g.64611  ORF Transcript_41962/g.64611 Transcript_41962/m.64611 type:complete len:249 (-) Transcript_41962:200-946(-)
MSQASFRSDPSSTQATTMSAQDGKISGKKRVRLLQTPIVATINDGVSDAERDLTWWRQEDFDETKASVKRMCRGLRRERRFSNSLTDAYEHACGTFAGSAPQEIAPAHLESLRNSPEFADLFDDHGPRGLERLSSRLHAIRRQRHLQEVKHAVFLEQARQNISNRPDADLLAMHAEYASRKSRAFARLLGRADAWAAGEADSQTPVPEGFPGATGTALATTDEAEELPVPISSPEPESVDDVKNIIEL